MKQFFCVILSFCVSIYLSIFFHSLLAYIEKEKEKDTKDYSSHHHHHHHKQWTADLYNDSETYDGHYRQTAHYALFMYAPSRGSSHNHMLPYLTFQGNDTRWLIW